MLILRLMPNFGYENMMYGRITKYFDVWNKLIEWNLLGFSIFISVFNE